jgi:hypothetical protein
MQLYVGKNENSQTSNKFEWIRDNALHFFHFIIIIIIYLYFFQICDVAQVTIIHTYI